MSSRAVATPRIRSASLLRSCSTPLPRFRSSALLLIAATGHHEVVVAAGCYARRRQIENCSKKWQMRACVGTMRPWWAVRRERNIMRRSNWLDGLRASLAQSSRPCARASNRRASACADRVSRHSKTGICWRSTMAMRRMRRPPMVQETIVRRSRAMAPAIRLWPGCGWGLASMATTLCCKTRLLMRTMQTMRCRMMKMDSIIRLLISCSPWRTTDSECACDEHHRLQRQHSTAGSTTTAMVCSTTPQNVPSVAVPSGTNAGNYDAFVSKYDSAGFPQWTQKFGSASHDFGLGVSADGVGNVYISGETRGNLAGPNAGDDAFLAKYDAAGNHQWSQQLGTAADDSSLGVSADRLGNVYISGYTYGSLGAPNLGGQDAFVSKYNSAGILQWTRQFGTAATDVSKGVSADGLGNVYLTGYTDGSLAGPKGGGWDAFVTKFDAAGNHQWTKQLGTSATDFSQSVSADGLGNVYISGLIERSGVPYDAFVSKFDAAGNHQWTKELGTSATDQFNGVSADRLGNVYVSGFTQGSLGGPNAGDRDAFVSKYDSAGILQWTRQLGTTASDESTGVSADGLGNVFISGETAGSFDGPNAGAYDTFVSKYDAAGTLQWTRQLGSSANDRNRGVSADGLGNVYISGDTDGSLGGPINDIVTLVFPPVPVGFTGTTYARFRLSTDVPRQFHRRRQRWRSRRLPRHNQPAGNGHGRPREDEEDRQRHERWAGARERRHVRQRGRGAGRPRWRRRRGHGRRRAEPDRQRQCRGGVRAIHECRWHGEE